MSLTLRKKFIYFTITRSENFFKPFLLSRYKFRYSLVVQKVKNLPAMLETRVPSLGWEDPLEKEMAAHSRILAWRIPWTEEPGGL